MKVALGSDHRGYPHKALLIATLRDRGVEIFDQGCPGEDSADYPDPAFAQTVSLDMSQWEIEFSYGWR